MITDNSRGKRGFTLLEIMAAVLVLGVGLLAAIFSNVQVQKVSDRAYERMVAAQDAHRVIELMRNASTTGNFPQNVTSSFPNGGLIGGFNNIPGEQIAVTYASTTSDPLDITVTTSWREEGRRASAVQLRTLITQRA